jgi:hypothetical protein
MMVQPKGLKMEICPSPLHALASTDGCFAVTEMTPVVWGLGVGFFF